MGVDLISRKTNYENSYWSRTRKPLLVLLHVDYKDISMHSSVQLEMFTLNTWMSQINTSHNIITVFPDVNSAKRSYNPSELRSKCNNHLNTKYPDFYKIYTDASVDCHNVGAAFYDPQMDTNTKLNIKTRISIMHAELVAIAEAMSYILSINFNKFVILSDAKSALQHLARCTSSIRGIPIAYTILDILQKLQENQRVIILQWIPSHVGISGNERADIYAKQACSDGIEMSIKPYYSEYIYLIKQKCKDMWDEYFDERSKLKGIWYKTIQPQPCDITWIDNSSRLCRQDMVTAYRLRSGHIPLNQFAFLIKKVPSPICPDCPGVREDVYHILMECVRSEVLNRTMGEVNIILASPTSMAARNLYKIVQKNIKCRNK